jgi:hypothetical protein
MARLVAALVLAQSGAAPTPDSKPLDEPAGGGNSAIKQAIAQAAWSEADEALGRALQDMDFLDRSFERLESAAQGDVAERARKAKDASELVLQWVRQAAHHRSVAALNKVGDRVPFDPAKLDGDAQIGELVRVVKPPVVRGSEPQQVVLVRGEAEVE